MKNTFLMTVLIVAIISFGGCNHNDQTTIPDLSQIPDGPNCPHHPPVGIRPGAQTIAAIHSEFLATLYHNPEYVMAQDEVSREDAALATARQIFSKYGVTPPDDDDLRDAYRGGGEKAAMDPVDLVREILPPEEYKWWDSFADYPLDKASSAYQTQCAEFGTPEPGSMLETVVQVTLSSAEFWSGYRHDQEPRFQNPHVPSGKSWRHVIRFAVNVVVDGVSGGLAGAGTGWTGAGAAVVGGVVGGLASAGADHLLFD